MKLLVEFPETAFGSIEEAVSMTRTALVDAAKALGVGEPSVHPVRPRDDFRDAQSGEFVSEEQAAERPGTTVHEH